MKNKTPIYVLTGLGVVAAAAVAGLTRDQWMGDKPAVVASAPEQAKTTEPPAAPAQQPASTEQASSSAAVPAAQPEAGSAETTAPAAQPEVATNETAAPAVEPGTAPAGSVSAPSEPAGEQMATAQPEAQTAPSEPPATAPASQATATNAAPQVKVPAFDTVRVEKTGDAVIAGTAEAGAQVVVKLDGKEIGQTTANGDGAFVLVPEKPLPAGSGALTIEAKGAGEAEPTPSQQSVAVIVPAGDQPQEALVAVVSPDQPTKVLQKPEPKAETVAAQPDAAAETAVKPAKLVSIDAVDYDPAGNIVFSGQGEKGNTARIYIDNNFVGDAAVGDDGRWSFSGTADVAQGVHTLRVDGLDGAGKVLNRVEVPFFREQQSKVADAAAGGQPAATAAAQSGVSATTADAAPSTAQTTAQQPAPPAEVQMEVDMTPPAATADGSQTQPAATTGGDAPAASAKPKEGRVVIQPGNNLWRISRVLYGSGTKFTTLYEANKDQIRNPNRIYPGQVFRTPDVAAVSETIDPKRREPLKPDENTSAGQ